MMVHPKASQLWLKHMPDFSKSHVFDLSIGIVGLIMSRIEDLDSLGSDAKIVVL